MLLVGAHAVAAALHCDRPRNADHGVPCPASAVTPHGQEITLETGDTSPRYYCSRPPMPDRLVLVSEPPHWNLKE